MYDVFLELVIPQSVINVGDVPISANADLVRRVGRLRQEGDTRFPSIKRHEYSFTLEDPRVGACGHLGMRRRRVSCRLRAGGSL